MFKLSKAVALKVLKSLKSPFPTADTWTGDRIIKKFRTLAEVAKGKPRSVLKKPDKNAEKVLASIFEAIEDDENIVLVSEKEKIANGKPKAAKGGKPAKKGKPVEDDDEDEDEDDSEEEDEDEDDDDDEDSEIEEEEEDEEEDSEDEESDEEDDEEEDEEEDSDEDDEEDSEEEDEDEDEDLDDDEEESEESEDEDDEDEDEEDEDVAEAAVKKGGKKKAGKDTPKKRGVNAGKGGFSSAGGEGKPGVIASIVEFLQAAKPGKGVTKDAIVNQLRKRFKDRPAESLRSTVNQQVPNKLRNEKDLNVQRDPESGGYYIKAAGKAKKK